jgi:MFS family permease
VRGARDRLGPLQEREFRLLFLGRATSMLGNGIAPVALAFAVLRLTGSKTDLGLVLVARQVPQIVFLLIGGVFADRLPRHHVMVAANSVAAVSQAGVAVLLLTGHASIWGLAGFAALNGTATAFSFPAAMGIVPEIVSPARLQSANVLLRLTSNGIGIAGPVVGGLVVAATNPGWAIAFDAATFALATVFLGALRLPPGLRVATTNVVADLVEGWREFRARRWLWAIVVQFSIVNAAQTGAINVLGPAQAQQRLGGAAAFGVILAGYSAGFIGGGLLSLRFRPRRILLAATLAVFAGAALPFVLAFPAPLTVIVVGAFVAGVGTETFGVLWTVATQQHIPRELLSRLTSYDALGSWVLMPVGLAAAGPLADLIGMRAALLSAAALIVLATAPVLLVREVRDLERRDAVPVEGA